MLSKTMKLTLEQAIKAQKGSIGTLSLILALDGGQWSSHPSHFIPPWKRSGTHSTERWVGQSGQVRKILPPPRFDPWTFQPVASHCTNYAILAHKKYSYNSNNLT